MDQFDKTAADYLREVGASCSRLLYALHESPEAVWGEIMRMESACYALKEACSIECKMQNAECKMQNAEGSKQSAAADELLALIEALRVRMAKDGLIEYQEFADFRLGMSALQRCVERLRKSFPERITDEERPLKTCVFFCSNHVDARRLAMLGAETDTVNAIGLPCSGKVDVPYLAKALETGADAVAIVACRKQECRHFEGSSRAHKRAEAVESLLEEIGLGAGRITVIECAPGGTGQVDEQLRQFLEQVRNLPQDRAPTGTMNMECAGGGAGAPSLSPEHQLA